MGAVLFLSMIDALSCKLRQGAPNPAYCSTAVACASAIPSTIPPSGFGYGRTNRRKQEGGGSSGGGRMRRGGHENGGEKGELRRRTQLDRKRRWGPQTTDLALREASKSGMAAPVPEKHASRYSPS